MAESPKDQRGLTRRGLFRSIGGATLVAGCVQREPGAASPGGEDPSALEGALGLEPTRLEFTLDGQPVRVEVEARTTLLELLRLDLEATGTKLGCERGACGACMVLVEGTPRNSCMLLALDLAGLEVETVAGLAEGERLSPLQYAFIEHDALQCGFCTSGMLISSSALLRRSAGRRVEREEVEEAIAGNLCRCGSYPNIVDAVLAIANHEGGGPRRAELIRAKGDTP